MIVKYVWDQLIYPVNFGLHKKIINKLFTLKNYYNVVDGELRIPTSD